MKSQQICLRRPVLQPKLKKLQLLQLVPRRTRPPIRPPQRRKPQPPKIQKLKSLKLLVKRLPCLRKRLKNRLKKLLSKRTRALCTGKTRLVPKPAKLLILSRMLFQVVAQPKLLQGMGRVMGMAMEKVPIIP